MAGRGGVTDTARERMKPLLPGLDGLADRLLPGSDFPGTPCRCVDRLYAPERPGPGDGRPRADDPRPARAGCPIKPAVS
ncbi:hypothetical protein [Streptomyces thermoalcalitolerans]|uniref:hypothetical protein n=1 Tax=Streptomyces thermoalcalitolerans TaxID=65605 RepID=UPI0031D5DB92